jgi:hypothetical protein
MPKLSFLIIGLGLAWQAIAPVVIVVIFEILKTKINWMMPVTIGVVGIIFPFSGYYFALSSAPVFKKMAVVYRGLAITTTSMILTGIIAKGSWFLWAFPIVIYIINKSRSMYGCV